MRLTQLFVAVALCVPMVAVAQNKRPLAESMSGQGYGVAGCGLGSIVFGQQSGPVQIVAATLNGTGVQTFGITTGTSNCGSGVFNAQMIQFIESNQVALANDASRGQGETINSLSSLMGCSDASALGTQLKANYGEIFATQNSEAISQSINATVAKSQLACTGA